MQQPLRVTGIDPGTSVRRLVLHCPDITLKGGNQPEFQRQLVGNVRRVLRAAGLDCVVGSARGRV